MLLRVRHSAEMEHVLVSRFGSSCELQLTHHGFLTASLRLAHDRGASQRLAPPANLVAFLTPVRNPAPMHTSHAVESRGPYVERKNCPAPSMHQVRLTFLSNLVAYVFQAAVTKRARPPRRGRKAKAGIVSARTARPVTLAPGGSASCPVIASGKRPANGAAGRRPPSSDLAELSPWIISPGVAPAGHWRKPASTSCGNSARKTVRSFAVSRLRATPLGQALAG